MVRPAEAPESIVGPQGPRFGLGVDPALLRVPRAPLDHLIRGTRFWETVYEWSVKSLYGGIDCGCARFFWKRKLIFSRAALQLMGHCHFWIGAVEMRSTFKKHPKFVRGTPHASSSCLQVSTGAQCRLWSLDRF